MEIALRITEFCLLAVIVALGILYWDFYQYAKYWATVMSALDKKGNMLQEAVEIQQKQYNIHEDTLIQLTQSATEVEYRLREMETKEDDRVHS